MIYAGSAVNEPLYVSHDGGASLEPLPEAGYVGRPRRLSLGPAGRLYLAAAHDGFYSRVP
jgi:hypothetical protein